MQNTHVVYTQAFTQRVNAALVKLLSSGHLYQSCVVDPPPVPKDTQWSVAVGATANQLIRGKWVTKFSQLSLHALVSGQTNPQNGLLVVFTVPDIRLFCTKCNRKEPFNPVGDTEPTVNGHLPVHDAAPKRVQVYALTFVCQGCKGTPEVLLVRREGLKFTLCGRAPIEQVEVPNAIPKQIREHFSNAVVAYQSGQILAGLFQLRVCIEQWAYLFKATATRADDALAAYADTLPTDFRSRFSSLGTIYGNLSIAIHAAKNDSRLFDNSLSELVEHFDARRLYKLAPPPVASQGEEQEGDAS